MTAVFFFSTGWYELKLPTENGNGKFEGEVDLKERNEAEEKWFMHD